MDLGRRGTELQIQAILGFIVEEKPYR